jgi:hypothetical protein
VYLAQTINDAFLIDLGTGLKSTEMQFLSQQVQQELDISAIGPSKHISTAYKREKLMRVCVVKRS